jgi:hypothetical protein
MDVRLRAPEQLESLDVRQEILTVPEHVILHPLSCPFQISSFCIVLIRVEQEILTVPEHVIIHSLWFNGCKITCSGTVRISCSTLNKTIRKDENWKGNHNECMITCSGTVRISCSTLQMIFCPIMSFYLSLRTLICCTPTILYVQRY